MNEKQAELRAKLDEHEHALHQIKGLNYTSIEQAPQLKEDQVNEMIDEKIDTISGHFQQML